MTKLTTQLLDQKILANQGETIAISLKKKLLTHSHYSRGIYT